MSAAKSPEPKHDFINRFLIGSGGTMSNGVPIRNITLSANASDPFVSVTVHLQPAEAIQIGKALVEHGERMVQS